MKQSKFPRAVIEVVIRGLERDTAEHGQCRCQSCRRLDLWRAELEPYLRDDEGRLDAMAIGAITRG